MHIFQKQSENRGGRGGGGGGGGRDNRGGGGGGGMGHYMDGDRRSGGPSGNNMDDETFFPVPGEKCGLVIGKGGENIRNIMSTSGAFVELQKNCPPDARTKNFVIRGSESSIQTAIQEICRKAGIVSGILITSFYS
jgi:far upstream element-binding protein